MLNEINMNSVFMNGKFHKWEPGPLPQKNVEVIQTLASLYSLCQIISVSQFLKYVTVNLELI